MGFWLKRVFWHALRPIEFAYFVAWDFPQIFHCHYHRGNEWFAKEYRGIGYARLLRVYWWAATCKALCRIHHINSEAFFAALEEANKRET